MLPSKLHIKITKATQIRHMSQHHVQKAVNYAPSKLDLVET